MKKEYEIIFELHHMTGSRVCVDKQNMDLVTDICRDDFLTENGFKYKIKSVLETFFEEKFKLIVLKVVINKIITIID